MSEEFIPKNKQQAEGYAIDKSFVQGFTDRIKEKDAEIERLREDLAIQLKQVELWNTVSRNKDAEIARFQAIVQRQKEALDRWAASCDCEQRRMENNGA